MQTSFAEQYARIEQWHWWFRGRRRVLEAILRRELPAGPPRRVLSAGCGPAAGLTWLVPYAGPRGKVVGLDLDPIHARGVPDGIEFVRGSLEQSPWADASFDVVLALDVLEHLDDDAAGLREALRLVKPGGLAVIAVPALPSLWGGQDIVSHHRRRYTRQSLFRLFAQAGVARPRIRYFNSLLFPATAAVRWSRRATGAAGVARSDFEGSRPGFINDALAWVFGAERYFINYAAAPLGVSLVATWRPRRSGPVT